MSPRFLLLWFLGLGLAAALSRAQLAADRSTHCSFDGLPIESAGRIDLLPAQGKAEALASFCSVECALAWPGREQSAATTRFVVHEERHGSALDPSAAFFARTPARSAGARGTLRAFADPLSAAEYARAFDAQLVPNPFDQDR